MLFCFFSVFLGKINIGTKNIIFTKQKKHKFLCSFFIFVCIEFIWFLVFGFWDFLVFSLSLFLLLHVFESSRLIRSPDQLAIAVGNRYSVVQLWKTKNVYNTTKKVQLTYNSRTKQQLTNNKQLTNNQQLTNNKQLTNIFLTQTNSKKKPSCFSLFGSFVKRACFFLHITSTNCSRYCKSMCTKTSSSSTK